MPGEAPSRPDADLAFQTGRPASRAPIAAIAVGLVALAAAGGWYVMSRRSAPPAPASAPPTLPTPAPEAAAALARVKELEEKLRTLEAERAAAGAKAAEDARRCADHRPARGRAAEGLRRAARHRHAGPRRR